MCLSGLISAAVGQLQTYDRKDQMPADLDIILLVFYTNFSTRFILSKRRVVKSRSIIACVPD